MQLILKSWAFKYTVIMLFIMLSFLVFRQTNLDKVLCFMEGKEKKLAGRL